jgi:hypothetical protein
MRAFVPVLLLEVALSLAMQRDSAEPLNRFGDQMRNGSADIWAETEELQPTEGAGTGVDRDPNVRVVDAQCVEGTSGVGLSTGVIRCLTRSATEVVRDCDRELGFEFDARAIEVRADESSEWTRERMDYVRCAVAPGAAPITVTQADFRFLPLTASPV